MTFGYDDRIQNTPLVFAQTTTDDGNQAPRNVQVMDVGIDKATIEFCEQSSSDGCDTHNSESVEGWAIDPQLAERGHTFDWGTVSVSDSSWKTVTFDNQDYDKPPVVLAMVQTEEGDQEALYSEVKDVTADSAKVRYCEGYDDQNSDQNGCDGHNAETVAWVAIRNRDDGEVWMDTDQAAEGCFTTTKSELTVDVDGSCTEDDHSPLSELQFRWDWENDGYWDTNWLSSPTASHTYSSSGEYWIRMQVKDEAADVDSAYRSVSVNTPPTASFTGTTSALDLDVDASDSNDPDGDSLEYEWDWDDGTSDTTTSETYSHTYDVCPDGSFDVTLTVRDGNGGSDSETNRFSVEDHDDDGDSLVNCREDAGGTDACGNSFSSTDASDPNTDNEGFEDGAEVHTHCTDPNDPDTDDDEFSDIDEVDPSGSESYFGLTDSEAQEVFCGDAGCAYPDPRVKDIYFELDGIKDHCTILVGCDQHMITESERGDIVSAYQSSDGEPVNAYFDTGQYGSDSSHGGQFIDDDTLNETAEWGYLEDNIEDNGQHFDSRRAGIFHHMVAVHDLEANGVIYCGLAQSDYSFESDNRADFSATAFGDIRDGSGNCDDGDTSLSVKTTVLEEFGHNFFGDIEPVGDQCDDDSTHEKFGDWAMDGGDCDPEDVNENYFDPAGAHRWHEAKNHVSGDTVETECNDSNVDDPQKCPSPGDLNDGLVGKFP